MTGKTVSVVGGSTQVVCGYAYDALDRLTNLASNIQGQGSSSLIDSYTYTYEQNRSLITSIAAASSANHAYAYDPARQLIQEDGTAFQYDAAGRPTRSGNTNAPFPATLTTYGTGNQLGCITDLVQNATVALNIRCDSHVNIADWLVEANCIDAISAQYHSTYSTFIATNIPLGVPCSWAMVTLDGRSAKFDDGQSNTHWGIYQPATNHELHFAVSPACGPSPGVFPVPVHPVNNVYGYDPAGQMTNRIVGSSSVSYSYDSARNMKQCVFDGGTRTNLYFYDHARRLAREVHTCTGIVEQSFTYIYEGMDIIAKFDETTGEMVYFTRGLVIAPGVGDVIAETHILGSLTQTYVYVHNHRGDTVALVDSSNGTVVARYDYDAWGNPVSSIQEPGSPTAFFTFSGKHYDADAGLYYYGYRWYDAVAKRWTQPDPEGLAEGLDLYRFCGNDPVNKRDLLGDRIILTQYGYADTYDIHYLGWERAVVNRETMPRNAFGMVYGVPFEMMPLEAFGGESMEMHLPLGLARTIGRAYDFSGCFVVAGAGSVPGVGEAMDIATVVDKNSGPWDRALACASLSLNVVFGGVLPNYGQIRGVARAARVAEDVLDFRNAVFIGETMFRVDDLRVVETSLRRPYLRVSTREAIESAAIRTPEGFFLDANTGEIIQGDFHYGHTYEHENWRILEEARARNMTQQQLNDWVNSHPEWFQIESPANNVSHKFEAPR